MQKITSLIVKISTYLFAGFLFLSTIVASFWLINKSEMDFTPTKVAKNNISQGELFYSTIGTSVQTNKKVNKKYNKSQYTIEITTVNSIEQAKETIAMLEKKSVKAYFTPIRTSHGVMFKIRVGNYKTQLAAKKAIRKLGEAKDVGGSVAKLL